MACQQCQNTGTPCHHNLITSCSPLNITKGINYDASCIFYTGAKLTCSDIDPNTDLQTLLQAFDTKLCTSNSTDFSLYDLACLDEDIVITTEQQWVEAVSERLCEAEAAIESLSDTTEDISTLETQVESIVQPQLTLPPITNTSSSSSLNQLLVGLGNAINTVNNNQSISTVDWDAVYTSSATPSTIAEGFIETLTQLGLLKDEATAALALPTFNTTSYCLATSGASVPLITVVQELMLKDCSNVTYSPSLVSWGCISVLGESPSTPSLTDSMRSLAGGVNTLFNERKTFDTNFFSSTPNVGGCSGNNISLRLENIPNDQVKVQSAGTAGYLQDRLIAGTGISFSVGTNAITINNTVPASNNQVKTESGGTAGYLIDKITGSTSEGITLSTSIVSDAVKLVLSVDPAILSDYIITAITEDGDLAVALAAPILEAIEGSVELKDKLCTIISTCI